MELKFSHDYEKLPLDWQGKKARLIALQRINLEDQTKQFLEYDTKIRGGGNYPLPKKGKYILLLFEMVGNTTFFTTIRRYTMSKHNFYQTAYLNRYWFTLVKTKEKS
jgi:hypothetical protein